MSASQGTLRITAAQAYGLWSAMELAGDDLEMSAEDSHYLCDALTLVMEEHGVQGDTLEEVLS